MTILDGNNAQGTFPKTESATYSPTNQANRSIDSQVFEIYFSISYLRAKLEISSFKH